MRNWILVRDKFINVDHIRYIAENHICLGDVYIALKPEEYERVIRDLLNVARKEVKLPNLEK